MNPKLYTDILRVLQGSRLVAKAVVTVVGNDTTSISSSLGKHVAEVLVHAQNVIKSRPTDSSSPSTCNDGISKYEMKTSNNFNETTPITEFHTPNLSESTPINLKTDLKGSISTEYTKLGSVQTLSSVIKSENVSFPTIDIHPTVKHDATSPSSIETMESYSSYSHIQEGRPVPSTRISRAMGFASLGVGLAAGTAMEYASRLVGQKQIGNVEDTSIVFNASNSDRLAKTLCRMRGAALKLGQLLSIQDEDNLSLPTPLSKALQHVRQNAEAMPLYQLRQQLKKEWKDQYDEKEHLHVSLESMDSLPFAAASIGECLRGVLKKDFSSGKHRHVVIKVQYPGVAESIESDLSNLQMLVSMTGLAPKGLFLDNIIRVGRQELKVECDYIREAQNQKRFKGLIEKDDELQRQRIFVPAVIDSLSTQKVLATEYCPGYSIDIVSTRCDQEERNRIARAILYLTMKELFCWRFMQTDPNWGNFLYDPTTKSTYLIDFGAAREYSKTFVDGYLRIVWASAVKDEETLINQSHRMGFLTGKESSIMTEAHRKSAYTVGEPFASDSPYDFASSGITHRISEYGSVFLQHRLTPPPEEVYTLHRKLAGTYNLCIKLGANIKCQDLLIDIVKSHKFDDGLEPPLTEL